MPERSPSTGRYLPKYFLDRGEQRIAVDDDWYARLVVRGSIYKRARRQGVKAYVRTEKVGGAYFIVYGLRRRASP